MGVQRGSGNGLRAVGGLLGGAGLSLVLSSCGVSREVAIRQAKEGDLLVRVENTQVLLARAFEPGVANGLYRGAVRVKQAGQEPGGLHEVSAVCSIEGEPGWQSYDNLYGEAVNDLAKKQSPNPEKRWQVLYHFDGRVEARGRQAPYPWAARLKDNLCRRGDFDDRPAHLRGKP